MTVRQKILEAIADLQGAGSQAVLDQDIATKVDLDLEEVKGHLDLLSEDDRLELRKSFDCFKAFLRPRHKVQMKEAEMPEEEESPATAVDPRKVFVVHGRNGQARDAMFRFLRALELFPMDWEDCVQGTDSGSPFNAEAVSSGMATASAIVVLNTPDDVVRLHELYVGSEDGADEKEPRGQPRPNVIFEAGMAFARYREKTIVTVFGRVKKYSDVDGWNVIRFSRGDDVGKRSQLVRRLKKVGCSLNNDRTDWHTEGDFQAVLESLPSPENVVEPEGSITEAHERHDKAIAKWFLEEFPEGMTRRFLAEFGGGNVAIADRSTMDENVRRSTSLGMKFINDERKALFESFASGLEKALVQIDGLFLPYGDAQDRLVHRFDRYERDDADVDVILKERDKFSEISKSTLEAYEVFYTHVKETWPDLVIAQLTEG